MKTYQDNQTAGHGMQHSLENILKRDLHIPRRASGEATLPWSDTIRQLISEKKLVYTVFDGDQELMCGLMRSAIMKQGMVPVNPPSILGYRDTVVRNRVKADVLREDVALLNKSDQVWIFVDLHSLQRNKTPLPEGALFELLFVKLFRPAMPVFTVDTESLFTGNVRLKPFSLNDITQLSEQKSIEELTNQLLAAFERMPKIRYYYYDPLDFKYGEWLRSFNDGSNVSPLDPMLSVRLLDGQQSLGCVGQAWLSLLRLADEVCHVSSLHEQEGSSLWCAVVEEANRSCFSLPTRQISWADLDVPKALLGAKWPVTTREAEILSARNRIVRLCA